MMFNNKNNGKTGQIWCEKHHKDKSQVPKKTWQDHAAGVMDREGGGVREGRMREK